MRSIWLISLALFAIIACSDAKFIEKRSADSGDDDLDTKVKDGTIAKTPYEWLASLKIGGEKLCGGALIHPRFVLTAAHCLINLAENKKALTSVNLNSTTLFKGSSFSVEKHLPHPKYKPAKDLTMYDIGLLKLSEPVPEGTLKPIPIPKTGGIDTEYGGKQAMVLGWGRTEIAGITSMLREGIVNLVNNADCRRQAISKYQICANVDEKQPIACHGDSGGPVVMQTGKNAFVQVGVVSYGTPALGKEHCFNYDIYTKVVGYLDWIDQTIKDNL